MTEEAFFVCDEKSLENAGYVKEAGIYELTIQSALYKTNQNTGSTGVQFKFETSDKHTFQQYVNLTYMKDGQVRLNNVRLLSSMLFILKMKDSGKVTVKKEEVDGKEVKNKYFIDLAGKKIKAFLNYREDGNFLEIVEFFDKNDLTATELKRGEVNSATHDKIVNELNKSKIDSLMQNSSKNESYTEDDEIEF